MLSILRRRREAAHAGIVRKADDLAFFLGDGAIAEAYRRRDVASRAGRKLWGAVARELAGRPPGISMTPTHSEPERGRIAAELMSIASAIAAGAYGRGHAATLHNAGAAVRRLSAAYPAGSVARVAGKDLCRLIATIGPQLGDLDSPAAALRSVSPRIDAADAALARFGSAVLPV